MRSASASSTGECPPVLANSLPRGGPFLLATALEALGLSRFEALDPGPAAFNFKEARRCLADGPAPEGKGVAISPFAPCVAPAATMRRWLSRVPRGCYIMGQGRRSTACCGPLCGVGCWSRGSTSGSP